MLDVQLYTQQGDDGIMTPKPTYEELLQKVKILGKETARRQRAEKALRRQNAYFSALHETSLGLINRHDRKELLEAILDHAALLSGTEHGFFYLLEMKKATSEEMACCCHSRSNRMIIPVRTSETTSFQSINPPFS